MAENFTRPDAGMPDFPTRTIDAATSATYVPPSKRFDVTHRIDSMDAP
ncbi:hypothetical protein ACFWBB_29240 [Streptomyces sp. NPDC060000]